MSRCNRYQPCRNAPSVCGWGTRRTSSSYRGWAAEYRLGLCRQPHFDRYPASRVRTKRLVDYESNDQTIHLYGLLSTSNACCTQTACDIIRYPRQGSAAEYYRYNCTFIFSTYLTSWFSGRTSFVVYRDRSVLARLSSWALISAVSDTTL